MRNFLIFVLISGAVPLSHAASWTGYKGCGLYEAKGVVRIIKHTPTIVLNEGTNSEIKLTVPVKNEPVLSPYLDLPFTAEVKISSMDGSLGKGEVQKIDSRLPHPLNPKDTGLKFLKKSECAK